jgi:hypothetical protein
MRVITKAIAGWVFAFFAIMLTVSITLLSSKNANADGNYIFGGPKLFYYNVDQSDVDQLATDLVNLGFSTATVKANDAGLGFDIGLGFPVSDTIDIETSFVYLGEFELTATTTGPAESIKATSSGISIPIVAKIKFGTGDSNLYGKAGWHFWRQDSEISASKGKVTLWGTGNDPVIGFGGQWGNFDVSYEHYSFSGVGAGAGIGEGGMSAVSATWKAEF